MPVECQICYKQFNKIVAKHIKTHGISVNEYRTLYPDAIFIDFDRAHYINKALKIHGNKYDYSMVTANRSTDKVKILCKIHGIFEQQLNSHIDSKQGCPKCCHNYPLTEKDFITRSLKKYGDKYRLISNFVGIKHPVTLSCKKHGNFILSTAEVHFRSNGGCPKCVYELRIENLKPGNISKSEKEWLDSLNISIRQHKIQIDNETFIVDGFNPITETVYEYYGSFWHGNPNIYNSIDINTKLNKTFGELYQKTILREQKIRKKFKLITKWG